MKYKIIIFCLLITACKNKTSFECMSEKNKNALESIFINELGENHHSIYTSIIIKASSNEVWDVMRDFENMPNWSSTLKKIEGKNLANKDSVNVTFRMNGKDQVIPHKFIYSEDEYYGWSDTLLVLPGIVDKHLYRVVKIDSLHTKFVQSDEFNGQNPNINTLDLARYVLPIYLTFNRELKQEVEHRFKNID